jgi:hypothetical protein
MHKLLMIVQSKTLIIWGHKDYKNLTAAGIVLIIILLFGVWQERYPR